MEFTFFQKMPKSKVSKLHGKAHYLVLTNPAACLKDLRVCLQGHRGVREPQTNAALFFHKKD